MSGTDVARPKSPMEEFQDNLKKSLRDDIARMLPDAAVAELIQRVIQEEFFTKRTVPKPDQKTVQVPSAFQQMVVDAAKPILEREAAKLVEKLEYKIAEQIKETVEAGALGVVTRAMTTVVNQAFFDSEQRFKQAVVAMLKNNGLQINCY